MDKKIISFLVDSLSSDVREPAEKYVGKTAGQIAKEETGIAFICNNAFVMDCLICFPDAEHDWFTPVEALVHLSSGLIGHVGDVPVYSDWYYGTPSDHQRPCDAIARVGVVNISANEISLLTVEQFAR